MKILLDTQMVIWAIVWPSVLPKDAKNIITNEDNEVFFSPISLMEVAIKNSKNRPDFRIDAKTLYRKLLDNGFLELAVSGIHCATVGDLPLIHKDPFDRILVAQAKHEGITLLTTDEIMAGYPAPILRIWKN